MQGVIPSRKAAPSCGPPLAADAQERKATVRPSSKWRRVHKGQKCFQNAPLCAADENDASSANMSPKESELLIQVREKLPSDCRNIPHLPTDLSGEKLESSLCEKEHLRLSNSTQSSNPSTSTDCFYDSWAESAVKNDDDSGSTYSPPFDPYETPEETVRVRKLVAGKLLRGTKEGGQSSKARPFLTSDIMKCGKDVVHVSNIPPSMNRSKLYAIFEAYGKITSVSCEPPNGEKVEAARIIYDDQSSAQEAVRSVSNENVGSTTKGLQVELRRQEASKKVQVFVGDLTSDITERVLEDFFSELVGSPVKASLKRDAETGATIGYGFLTCSSEEAATRAVIFGHRARIGNTNIRVGRAERNTYLYIPELANDVSVEDIWDVFGKYGELIEEDTTIIRRSYAFVRYVNREDAENAKRALDKTQLKGRIIVRYAEAEHLHHTVAIQFHVPRPPNNLPDLLHTCFSKYGNCTVEIPRLRNGQWRKVAFVSFEGDTNAAQVAAAEAVRHVKFVSDIPVMVQFARELIPRMPASVTVARSRKKSSESGNRETNGSARSPVSTSGHPTLAVNHQAPQLNRYGDQWVPIVSYVPKSVLCNTYVQINSPGSSISGFPEGPYVPTPSYSAYAPPQHIFPHTEWSGMVHPHMHMWPPHLYLQNAPPVSRDQ